MRSFQIRNVPDQVGDTLAREAARRGQSHQDYLLSVVTQEARRATNVEILAGFADRTDGTDRTGETDRDTGGISSAADRLRQARAEREGHLLSLVTGVDSAAPDFADPDSTAADALRT